MKDCTFTYPFNEDINMRYFSYLEKNNSAKIIKTKKRKK